MLTSKDKPRIRINPWWVICDGRESARTKWLCETHFTPLVGFGNTPRAAYDNFLKQFKVQFK